MHIRPSQTLALSLWVHPDGGFCLPALPNRSWVGLGYFVVVFFFEFSDEVVLILEHDSFTIQIISPFNRILKVFEGAQCRGGGGGRGETFHWEAPLSPLQGKGAELGSVSFKLHGAESSIFPPPPISSVNLPFFSLSSVTLESSSPKGRAAYGWVCV